MSRFAVILAVLCLTVSAAGQGTADLILINGSVRTLNKNKPFAEAVASSDGKIIAVGTNAEIRKLIGPGTVVIDAKQRLVLPGFNDAHVHFTAIGNRFSHLDLRNAKSADEVVEKIEYYCRFLPKGRWLIGAGLDATRWKTAVLPALERIDAASPDNPVLLYFADPKSALINSAAQKRASTAAVSGNIVRGPELSAVRNAIPKNSATNFAEFAETASNYAASLGVTSVQDVHSDNDLAMLAGLAMAGRLKTRVYDCVGLRLWEDTRPDIKRTIDGQRLVRGGCVKWYSDGSSDELPELRSRLAAADKAGIQVLVHAIGEAANSNVLEALEYALAQNGSRDRRSRIEHAHWLRRQDFQRLQKAGIIASMQPFLFFNNGSTSGDDHRAILKSGVKLALGSDASMVDLNPLLGIHAAVNAGDRSLSVEDAVIAYTLGSAYAEFQEDQKGTIEVGKLADLIILSDDIFRIKPAEIGGARVLTTIVGGDVVFRMK
ncbi:MAG: amidohydrolase [Acidobacteria bacterium]|nr:amidohydrolase [Acidobacteriota bacterium]